MTSFTSAIRAGITGGLIELRQSFTGTALIGQLFWPVATLAAIFFLRNTRYGGFDLGALILPSTLGMFAALGMVLILQYLSADREDVTLLRAKATPNGVRGYLIGKFVTVSGSVLAYLIIILIPGLVIVGGLDLGRPASWLTLAWVLILGSLIASQRGVAYLSLPVIGLIAISGIFYPITALPAWLQSVGQIFPIYWLGLGMRSALLPTSAATIEIGQSCRPLETAGVLGAWVVFDLIVAPIVLRRMARRESGSRITERRDKALQHAR